MASLIINKIFYMLNHVQKNKPCLKCSYQNLHDRLNLCKIPGYISHLLLRLAILPDVRTFVSKPPVCMKHWSNGFLQDDLQGIELVCWFHGSSFKGFSIVFLFSDWLKSNHLRSRIKCGFLNIFSSHICSTVTETIRVTNYATSFGVKKCSENQVRSC